MYVFGGAKRYGVDMNGCSPLKSSITSARTEPSAWSALTVLSGNRRADGSAYGTLRERRQNKFGKMWEQTKVTSGFVFETTPDWGTTEA
jgi:hypothetical protein